MPQRQTEQLHSEAEGLDALALDVVAGKLLDAQLDALGAVRGALADIARGACVMAAAVREGRQIVYAAAGSSGLMAMADACELAGTFGLDPGKIRILFAGGIPQDATLPGGVEDDRDEAAHAARVIGPGDAVIVLSASGRTPYALALAQAARDAGAHTICIANNRGAPLLDGATVPICLPTPPELVAGSTRMGAGTAQKAALNMLSTLMAVDLGHVHDGMMVNLRADNEKLRSRACGIVTRVAGCDEAAARAALDLAGGAVKTATVIAAGARTPERASRLLSETNGNLRAALARLESRQDGRESETEKGD